MGSEFGTVQIVLIIMLFIAINIFGYFLTYIEYYFISFIVELLGLIAITIYLAKSLESSPNEDIQQFLGLSTKSLYGVLFVAGFLSIPFWFSECFKMGSIVFYRRAFATYSYSTLIKAPIFEEIVFRGVIFSTLLKRYSPNKAIGYNALMFTAIHLQFGIVLFDFTLFLILFFITIFGGLLAYTQYKMNNLIIVILLHSIANLAIILFIPFDPIIANDTC